KVISSITRKPGPLTNKKMGLRCQARISVVEALRLMQVADIAPGLQIPGAILEREHIPTAVETFEAPRRLRRDTHHLAQHRSQNCAMRHDRNLLACMPPR